VTAAVLVVGESLIDVVHDRDGQRTEAVGGSPANVALGLARQGVAVRLLTALARDAYGERIAAHLAASGVEVDAASWSLERTSVAHARILADGSAAYAFDVEWTLPADLAVFPDLVHVGSVAAFLDPGATALEGIISRLPGRTLLTFDPNIRPELIGEHGAARARFEQIASRADLVKLSDEDAEWLYPGLRARDVCDRILRLGPRVVGLTRGGAGALLCAPGSAVDLTAPRVHVRDTVGAGDTFMAALVREALRLSEFLRAPDASLLPVVGAYAVAAAALTVQRVGADLPTAEEIAASTL
jgi:fructokinase